MSDINRRQTTRLTREDFLNVLDTTWGHYLDTVNTLTPEEQQAYAKAEGHPNLTSLIAHLSARFRRALDVVPTLIDRRPETVAAQPEEQLNRVSEAGLAGQTLEQVEQDFESLYAAVGGMVGDLPETALDNPDIYRWLYTTIVQHYADHEPPGDPQTPASRHGQNRPEPGEHITPGEAQDTTVAYDNRSATGYHDR